MTTTNELELDPKQRELVARIVSEPTRAALNTSDLGSGKTVMAVAVANQLGAETVLVVAPKKTLKKDGWDQTFAEWGFPHPVRFISPEHPENHANLLAGVPGAYLVGREFFYLSATASPDKEKPDGTVTKGRKARWVWTKVNPDLLVVDECFVGEKLVSTPSGPRRIDEIRVGDEVFGFDHATNSVVVTTVVHCMVHSDRGVIADLGATPNHPYYVSGQGYVPAGDLEGKDLGYYLRPDLRVLQRPFRSLSGESESEVLRTEVRREISGGPSGSSCGVNQVPTLARRSGGVESKHEKGLGGPRVSRSGREPNETEQPRTKPRERPEGLCYEESSWLCLPTIERWQRSWAYRTREAFARGVGWWLGRTLRSPHQNGSGFGVSNSLQDRFGPSRSFVSHRVRRAVTFIKGGSREGSKERRVFEGNGMDSLAILEPRNPGRYSKVCRKSLQSVAERVYNLETESGNYFADGFLVHNCHRMKNRYGLMYEVLKNVPAKFKLGMSATPQGSHFDGIWSVTRWLWPDIVDRSKMRWMAEWCVSEDVFIGLDEHDEPQFKSRVVGEKNPGAYLNSLPCVVRIQVEKKPYKLFNVTLDLGTEQRRVWNEMAEKSIAWLKDNPTVAKLPMEQRIRLRQMALAMPKVDPETHEVSFDPDAESSKLDAALKIQKRHPGKAILYVTDSRKFAEIAAPRLGAKLFVGGMKDDETDAIKRGFGVDFNYLVCTYQAVAEGVNGLQRNCNIEVLFNPADGAVANEQFSGRLNRTGQREDHVVRYRLKARDTLDDDHYLASVFNVQARRSELAVDNTW